MSPNLCLRDHIQQEYEGRWLAAAEYLLDCARQCVAAYRDLERGRGHVSIAGHMELRCVQAVGHLCRLDDDHRHFWLDPVALEVPHAELVEAARDFGRLLGRDDDVPAVELEPRRKAAAAFFFAQAARTVAALESACWSCGALFLLDPEEAPACPCCGARRAVT